MSDPVVASSALHSRAVRSLLVLACLLGLASASAQSHLTASTPASGSILVRAPSRVELRFSEPVVIGSSTFLALPLPVPYKAGETPAALGKRVRALASRLSAKLLANEADRSLRVDRGTSPSKGTTDTVAVNLKPGLQAGYYVVIWQVRSAAGHVTHGALVFDVQPGA